MRDYALSTTFDIKFTTRRFTTGVPFALAAGVISAYPDNSTTQLTAGITLTADFDGVTGLNNIRVVATSGNGYAAGSNYALVITTGTVDSVSVVGEVVGEFSLEAQSPLRPTTAGRTLVVDAAGLGDANTVKVGPTGSGTAQTGRDIGASVLLSTGTGTGQLDFTSGVVKANLVQILGTALTETAGLLAAAFKKFFNVATPSGTVNSIPDATAGAAGGLLIAGANAATTVNITGNLTGNVTGSVGSVTGAVGSVTGAVGSVTGNVGGNVTGSVGSVVAGVSILSGIKKNASLVNFEFLMTDSTNHNPVTGKTVTVTRSIDDGAFAAGTLSAVTEIAFGIYAVDFAAGDLNGRVICLRAVATGCDDLFVTIVPDP